MTRPTAYVHHEVYEGRGFSRLRDPWRRYVLARETLAELGFFPDYLRTYRQEPAGDDDLLLVHDQAYIDFVKRMDEAGSGYLDYGDTPAYRGVLRRARLAVGGTLLAARLVANGSVQHAFNPGGGLHHARRDRAGGFCVFNDVAVAVRVLQKEYGVRRIAILDCDGHHGDGTESVFYDEPVLTVSLHRYDGRFYPRSGTLEETGRGAGEGYNLNLPLPKAAGDGAFFVALGEAALPRLQAFHPELLFVQAGADGHHGDTLVRLGLSLAAYARLGDAVHSLAHELCAGRLVLVAGGGYKPESVARCWAVFLAAIAGAPPAALGRMRQWREEDQSPSATPEALAQVRGEVAYLRERGALTEPTDGR